MAISRIGSTSVNGATVASLPTHASGDILVALAYRSGFAVAPTVPAGWTAVTSTSGAANNNAAVLVWHLCTSSSESIPTFTNATQVIIVCYRGADNTTPFGSSVNPSAAATAGSATANDLQYPALTLSNTSGSSWVLGGVGIRSGSVAGVVGSAPTGMTNVTTVVDPGGGVLGSAGFHDTNTGAAAWSLVTVAQGASTGHRQITAELLGAAGGGVSVTVPLKTIAITKNAPAVAAGASVAVPLKTIAIAKFAPSVTAGSNINISVPVALLTISGKVPLVAAGKSVIVPLKALTLSKFAPGVSAGVSIAIPLKQLTLTKYAPAVTSTNGVGVIVPLASLHLAGFAPSVVAAIELTLHTNTQYEVYVLTRQNVWEFTRLIFTGNDFGPMQ